MHSNGPGYFLKWQAAVCGLIILLPFAVSVYVIIKVKAEPLHCNDLWKSQWKKLNPIWLLCYRALAFICMALILSKTITVEERRTFYYYTEWTFALAIVYFMLATLISAYGCFVLSNGPLSENDPTKTRQIFRFGGYLMQILYQIYGGAVILTDIVTWGLLVPFSKDPSANLTKLIILYKTEVLVKLGTLHTRGSPTAGLLLVFYSAAALFCLLTIPGLGICNHTLNAVFLLLDTALNSMPFPWFRFAYFVSWSCLYIVFQWVVHACCSSWWPYSPMLELSSQWAPLRYFALAVTHIPSYSIYVLIVKAKNSILPRLFPNAFQRIPR